MAWRTPPAWRRRGVRRDAAPGFRVFRERHVPESGSGVDEVASNERSNGRSTGGAAEFDGRTDVLSARVVAEIDGRSDDERCVTGNEAFMRIFQAGGRAIGAFRGKRMKAFFTPSERLGSRTGGGYHSKR